MSHDEDDALMTGVYVGVGLLLAVGAGYLVWRYVLSDTQKDKAKDLVEDATTSARRTLRDVRHKMQD